MASQEYLSLLMCGNPKTTSDRIRETVSMYVCRALGSLSSVFIPQTRIAQQTNPAISGTTQNFSGNNYLQFSYRKQKSAIDLTYMVQVSNDLVIWNSGTSYTVFLSQSDNGDGTDQMIVRDLTETSGHPRFMRL